MSKTCIRYANCWRLMPLALQIVSATLLLAFPPVGVVAADGGLFSADNKAAAAQRTPQDLFHEGGLAEGKPHENWHLGTAPRLSPNLRSRTARLDLQQLAEARLDVQARRPAKLMLNLFADAAFAAALERTEPTASGYALTGRIEGEPLSMVVLAVNGDLVEGTAWLPGATHSISARNGTASIRQLAPAKLPHPRELATPSAGDALDSATTSDGGSTFTVVADLANASDEAIPADDGSVIDVLVVYPPMVRQVQGGHRAMRTLIEHDIASTNEAYRVSEVRQRIALAGAFEVDYPSEGAEETGQDGLKLLVGKSDGHMDEVHALRNSYAADLVLFHEGDKGVIVPNFREFLILPDPMHQNAERFAFNAAQSNRVQFQFAHFLGHNMGLAHQRGAYPHKSGKFPYSHGYVLPKPSPPSQHGPPPAWHTIMAWGSPDVIPRFSNPNHRYPDEAGAPLGVPGDDWSDSVDGPADAVRSLNNTRQAVANFRNSGRRCTYDLSPAPPTLPSSGGEFRVQVSTASGCTWTARSHDQFVFVTQGTSGTGNGEVTYRVESNNDWDREAAVLVAGEIHLLKQFGSRPFMSVCDRALGIQRALAQTIGKPCESITAADLANLGILDLSNSGLTALGAGAFDGLSNLFELNLHSNQLTKLPPRAFSSLHRLQNLFLGENRLTNLPPGAFDGLPQLSELWLGGNLLATLERGAFSGLTGLEFLYLGGNNLTRLTPGVFEGLAHLKSLYLGGNELTKLEADWFRGLPRLTSLRINASLKTIEQGAFNGLANLQLLDLSHNELTAISHGAFKELPSLVDLWLGENNFQTIETGAFYGLSNLKTLSLRGHQLRVLQPGLLAGLPDLRELDLSGNNFNTLQAGLFDGLHNLQGLNIGGSSLQSLQSGTFEGLPNLKQLKMSSALRALDSGVFRGLSSLETLRLGGLLSALPPGLFNGLTNLKQLDLSGNPGAPFALNLDVVRLATGAPVQGRPLEMAIRVREGAPFDMSVGLSVSGGVTSLNEAQLRAGANRSDAISVTPNGDQPVTVSLDEAPAVPAGPLCLDPAYWLDGDRRPCFLGVQTVVGAPLTLYGFPEQSLKAEGSATLDLASVFAYFLGAATYEVESSNPRVASASIAGGLLTIAANGEGTVILTVTATGSDGSGLERRFRVTVAPPPPRIRGWRLWLLQELDPPTPSEP